MNKYQEWIDKYPGSIFRYCVEVCAEMKVAFPELTEVIGHVDIIEGRGKLYPHKWLKTPEGVIVDPTAAQWTGIIQYYPYEVGEKIPIGVCANCGEQIWGLPGEEPDTTCSDTCHRQYVAYIMGV